MEEAALESSRGGWEGSDAWSAHLPIMVLKRAYHSVGFFIRPFGWMNNGGDGGEGCFEQRRHSPGTKVTKCPVSQRAKNWLLWPEHTSTGHLQAAQG